MPLRDSWIKYKQICFVRWKNALVNWITALLPAFSICHFWWMSPQRGSDVIYAVNFVGSTCEAALHFSFIVIHAFFVSRLLQHFLTQVQKKISSNIVKNETSSTWVNKGCHCIYVVPSHHKSVSLACWEELRWAPAPAMNQVCSIKRAVQFSLPWAPLHNLHPKKHHEAHVFLLLFCYAFRGRYFGITEILSATALCNAEF